MKVKTSLTLSPELLAAIDRAAGPGCSRSAFVERAVWDRLRAEARRKRDERETELLNAIADGLLSELPDVLDYTVDWSELGDDVETIPR